MTGPRHRPDDLPRRRGPPAGDGLPDGAVSTVVGAILVIAIISLGLATIQTEFVPVWGEEADMDLMSDVTMEFTQLRGDLDRHVRNSSEAPVTSPVSLGSRSGGIMPLNKHSNALSFEPRTGETMNFSSNEVRILQVNGSSTASVDEEWTNISSDDTLEDVSEVHHFRIRLDCVGGCRSGGDNLSVEITDADGNFAGDFTVEQVNNPPDNLLFVQTRDDNKDVLVDQPTTFFGQQNISPYWVWADNPTWRFNQVLAAAEKPMNISLTENGLTGEYSISYTEKNATTGETAIIGAGGTIESPFKRSFSGGLLRYEAANAYMVDQDHVLEHGAYILEQEDGAVFKAPPNLDVGQVGNRTTLGLHIASLTGDEASQTGFGTLSVTTKPTDRESLVAEAPKWSWNLTTDYPDLWSDQLDEELSEGGLSSSAGEYNLTSGSDWVNMTVFGTTTATNSTEYDLTVTLDQASVDVKIRN